MPTSITCIYGGEEITVQEAVRINSELNERSTERPLFICISCGERVRPHRSGGQTQAHFEHFQRNNECPLSHGDSYSPNLGSNTGIVNPDTQEAIEGYSSERKLISHRRNAAIVVACKERDNYTCVSCGFHIRVNGRRVIDCHHLNPIGSEGERITSVDELMCLCPNCHRIAHTSSPPLSVDKIREIVSEL